MWGSAVGQESIFLSFLSHEFKFFLVWDFELFWEFSLFQEFHEFWVPQSLFRGWLHISHQMVRKNCIVYSLFCVVIISINIFLGCLIKLSLSQPKNFPFCPFLLPIAPGGGNERVGERLASVLLPVAGLNHNNGFVSLFISSTHL